MNPCKRYLRLFDLKKYREIQPVIDSIANRNVDCQQVIPLVEAAIDLVNVGDFEKYNDLDMKEIYTEDLQDVLTILREGKLLSWIDTKEYSKEKIYRLILLICCPKYQIMEYFDIDSSGTTIEYEDVCYGPKICSLKFFDMLDSSDSNKIFEVVSIESAEIRLSIFSRNQLTEIDKMISQDIATLSQLDNNLSESHSIKRLSYLEFFNDFKELIGFTNLSSDYTIIDEKSYV
jgi:hypothetical protein